MFKQQSQTGFSLIELLIAIAISAILVGLAIPEFNSMIRRNSVESTSNTLQTTFAYARSEAIKRATYVSVIPQGSWQGGWNVILDNGTRLPDCELKTNQDEKVLRRVDPQRVGTNVFENSANGQCTPAAAATGCFTFDKEGQNVDKTGLPRRSGFCVRDAQNNSIQRVVEFSQIGQSFLEKSQ